MQILESQATTWMVAVPAVVIAILAAGVLAGSVQANSWSPYCNNQKLSGWQESSGDRQCIGAPRTLHAVWGYGDQHSVCVWSTANEGMCASGPNTAVYNPNPPQFYWIFGYPAISNPAPGWNVVHGSAEVP